jgi:Mrp family chromosome partitioning ATPase
MKHYLEKLLVAKTRRQRWKAKKQYRIERREQLKRHPCRTLGLDQYITDVSAGIIDPPPLTGDTICTIMDEVEKKYGMGL